MLRLGEALGLSERFLLQAVVRGEQPTIDLPWEGVSALKVSFLLNK
jgi:hypothetical protein